MGIGEDIVTDHWYPKHKYQLVDWFFEHLEGKYSREALNRINKDELMGWYHNLRKVMR